MAKDQFTRIAAKPRRPHQPRQPTTLSNCLCCDKIIAVTASMKRVGGGKYCSYKCRHEYIKSQIGNRFWQKLDKSDECWIWKGKKYRNGYGQAYGGRRPNGKTFERLAHRMAYELAFGTIPEGLCVCHKCDNRLCCNPDHLFLGTQKENLQDMVKKGRAVKAEDSWTHKQPERVRRGMTHHTTRISDDDVRHIRARWAQGNISYAELGREMNLSSGAIWNIVNNVTWRHVI